MKAKKKKRRYGVSVSILGLDLAIYRFIYSFALLYIRLPHILNIRAQEGACME
jgi:hypothetical protein